MNIIISNKYKLLKTIGEGSFGKIFEAIDISTNTIYAIKIEKKNLDYSLLKNEAFIYNKCNSYKNDDSGISGISGIPKIYEFGIQDNYNYLVIDLIGNTLEYLLNTKIELKIVISIAMQLIKILSKLHSIGIIHRDIKPDNILYNNNEINNNENNIYYLIDYGLSKFYVNNNGKHKEIKTNKQLTGSIKYSSLNVQSGIEPSRRDDLESLGYVLIYLLKKKLPWQGAIGNNKSERHEYVLNIKKNITLIDLCSNLPYEFLLYMSYCRKLNYDETPNYNYLYNIFYNLYKLIMK
jgi:serine/threonine protein kinase